MKTKNTAWVVGVAAAFGLLVGAATVQAGLLAYDPFDIGVPGYTQSLIPGQNPPTLGFLPSASARAWGGSVHVVRPIQIVSKTLTHSGVDASTASGSLQAERNTASTSSLSTALRSAGTSVTSPAPTDGQVVVWASYLLEFDLANQASADFPFTVEMRFAPTFSSTQIPLSTGIDSTGKAFIEKGVPTTGAAKGTTALTGLVTHLFVIKAVRDNNTSSETFSLWVNPAGNTDETALGTATATIGYDLTGALFTDDGGDRFWLGVKSTLRNNTGSNPQQVWLDEFRLGTTLLDVVTPREPAGTLVTIR